MRPEEAGERLRLLREQWAKLDETARNLGAMEGVKLAELYNQYRGTARTSEDAKNLAKADPFYRQAIELASKAKSLANQKRAEIKGFEMRWETWRTMSATKRAEMKLT